MVTFSKSLIVNRYTGDEFKSSSVLNDGVSVEQINNKVSKIVKRNKARRMRKCRKY